MILRYVEKKVHLGEREYTMVIPRDIGGFVNREYIMDADSGVEFAASFDGCADGTKGSDNLFPSVEKQTCIGSLHGRNERKPL